MEKQTQPLSEIQNELKVPKGNFNAFGKYKYRSAEDILEAVKPIILKHNANLTLNDNIVYVGSKYFIQSTASLSVCGILYTANGYAELTEHKGMSAEQATGTASSYARKYALNGLFLIDETEQDADSQKPQTEVKSDLLWLNKGSDTWNKVVDAIASMQYSIADVEKKYKLSKAIKDELVTIQAKGK
jgi:hypothetical protein